jgi:radical SAM protein with 4Fe4S-binding SPASM domain
MPSPNWNDTLNLLSKLTLRRVWNGCKVLASYYLSQWTKKPIQWGMPLSLSFEPTTACNLRCPECPSGLRSFTRPTGMLEKDLYGKTLHELSRDLFYLIFYFQGEPYLHPEFLDLVTQASRQGLYTATSTNGHFLDEDRARQTVESGLDRLIISIDGTTQEVYEQYRVGGNLSKVLEGARRLVSWKKKLGSRKPFLIFQFLVVRPNEHQVDEIGRMAREIGADQVRYKTAQIYDYEQDPNGLIPRNQRFSRYRKDGDGRMQVRSSLENHCWRLWQGSVVTWDGLVVPCCFDKDARHRLGDLRDKTFRQIWFDPEYVRFRGRILKGRRNIDICSNCSEGTKVWGNA